MGLDNQFRINELIQSGSTAITSLDADGRHTYFVPEERGSRDGESSAYFEKPQYNEGELQKAVDTQVDELITPTSVSDRQDVVSRRAYQRVQSQLNTALQQIQDTQTEIQSLSSQVSDLSSQVASLNQQNQTLQEQIQRLQRTNQETVQDFREQISQKDRTISQREDRITQLEADIEARARQNTTLAARVTDASAQNQNLQSEINSLNSRNTALQQQISELQQRLQQTNTTSTPSTSQPPTSTPTPTPTPTPTSRNTNRTSSPGGRIPATSGGGTPRRGSGGFRPEIDRENPSGDPRVDNENIFNPLDDLRVFER